MIENQKKGEETLYDFSRVLKDPFQPFYLRAFCAYGLVLTFTLLWPFDFGFLHKNHVKWVQDANGVIFNVGQIISPGPCRTLYDKIRSGTGLSIELWVSSLKENQSGPARIISYSADPFKRNFTIAQEKNSLVIRLRTVYTDTNGIYPHAELQDVFSSQGIRHIVVTYDLKEERIFIDGLMRLRQPAPVGGFDNWDPSYMLVFGNESTGNRPWIGRIFYAAIYSQPISENTIREHYSMGWRLCGNKNRKPEHGKGLIARYCFNSREGTKVHDSSGSLEPTELLIHSVLHSRNKSYLGGFDEVTSLDMDFFKDIVLNVLAFIPLGFFSHAYLRTLFDISIKVIAAVLIVGMVFTISIESLQFFSATRTSSMLDVIFNLLGVFFGIAIDRLYLGHFTKWHRTLIGAEE